MSGLRQALGTLVIVAVAGAALDYHVISTHPAASPRSGSNTDTVTGSADASGTKLEAIDNSHVTGAYQGAASSLAGKVATPPAAASVSVRTMMQMMDGPPPDPAAVAAAEKRAIDAHELRVCADPNNLPFSNKNGDGFENALAELVAKDLGWTVRYTWWPQRRGFIRKTLGAGACDVVMGVPSSFEMAQPTIPYYRSTYVFVTRRDRGWGIHSFDDARLRRMRIGVHAIGSNYGNVPPAQALAARGVVSNLHGYSIYGDYSRPDPPRDLIDAVVNNQVDIAIAWGPLAGYFAKRAAVPLEVTAVGESTTRVREPPMTFAISMAVRRGDVRLERALDDVLKRRRADIRQLLAQYGVPVVPEDHASVQVASNPPREQPVQR